MKIDLREVPFSLNNKQIAWVEEMVKSMSLEEKIGQILCPALPGIEEEEFCHYVQKLHVGSMMIRPMKAEGLQEGLRKVQQAARIPLMIAANLESGGNGAVAEGTLYAMPEGCSATGDRESGYRLGKIACQEAASVGVNWGFAPLVDIDMSYRNPITNVRSFGADKEVVAAMAGGYLRAAREEGVASSIKHFPGDGVDERDQHLLVSVNSLSYQDWMDTYGYVYKKMIAQGAPSLMAGHIAQPAVARHVEPGISDIDAMLPGSLSKFLLTDFLRNELGFNGLIVTDSTLMVGFMQCMPRKKAVPYCIQCGCDVLLFNRNVDEDYNYMMEGYKAGVLSEERLTEAVIRVLALKASLNLHVRQQEGTLVPTIDPMKVIKNNITQQWVRECADKAVTLVKDNHKLLPLSPDKTKSIYLNVIENHVVNNSLFALDIKDRLEKEGFEVELRQRAFEFDSGAMMNGTMTPDMARIMGEVQATTEEFTSHYDMCMIVVNMETVSNATTVRIDWKVMFGMGNDIPWYAGEMPLVVMSTANPYHLLDIPMAQVYVNTYTASPETLNSAFDKLMGRSKFKGISPVDAFCGHEDCRVF